MNKSDLDEKSLVEFKENMATPPDLIFEDVDDAPFLTKIQPKTELTFSNPEEVKAAIEGYLNFCQSKGLMPTSSGLALSLGTNWQNLKEIMKDNNSIVAPVIRQALTHLTALVEQSLLSGRNSSGCFAWLKNIAGWTDKSEVTTIKTLTAAEVVHELNKDNENVKEADFEEV